VAEIPARGIALKHNVSCFFSSRCPSEYISLEKTQVKHVIFSKLDLPGLFKVQTRE
jgi:hypothetical protein